MILIWVILRSTTVFLSMSISALNEPVFEQKDKDALMEYEMIDDNYNEKVP